MGAKLVYKEMSGYCRRRLNAGGDIDHLLLSHYPYIGEEMRAGEAAILAVIASGRKPAQVFEHKLHYEHNYRGRRK